MASSSLAWNSRAGSRASVPQGRGLRHSLLPVRAAGSPQQAQLTACSYSYDACSTSCRSTSSSLTSSSRGRRAVCSSSPSYRNASTSTTSSLDLSTDTAVVIVDHGSRKRDSNDMLVHFGLLYQSVTGAKIVEIAHMEIAEPTIEQAIGKCVEAGASTVVVAPYFLSRGRHIQEDIPALIAEAQKKYPQARCIMADPIGIEPLMAQIIHNRVEGALAKAAAIANN